METTQDKRALLSVYDKSGLVQFGARLHALGWQLVASGGTAEALRAVGLPVHSIEDLTGLPSVLGGRVKTLHPAVHGGILAQQNAEDQADLERFGWGRFDLVAVDLYPFQQTVARPDVSLAEAIEQIDIGGVALIRAAAKNHARVTVITEPGDYEPVLAELEADGQTQPDTRLALAIKAFGRTAAYDAAISGYLAAQQQAEAALPPQISISLPQAQPLRYGENPHQQAAYYASPGAGPLGGELLHGKPLSYNNLLDLDAAWAAAAEFEGPAVAIIKHLSPCGIAMHQNLTEAYRQALASDPVSAFGGVIAVNRTFDEATAAALGDLFLEAIAAPGFTEDALDVLEGRKNLRLLRMLPLPGDQRVLRSVRGGLLAQTPDHGAAPGWRVVTQRVPDADQVAALRFAWAAVKHVKSNAIVLAQGQATVGIGGGLSSRVDAAELAIRKAGERASGAVLASDAFFPFPDGIEAAGAAGVSAVIQPGGSVRDEEVIAAADRLGLAMVFTGVRHFRH